MFLNGRDNLPRPRLAVFHACITGQTFRTRERAISAEHGTVPKLTSYETRGQNGNDISQRGGPIMRADLEEGDDGAVMNDQTKSFGETAKSLARNPLGIIALFIVMIYGFA